MKCILSLLISIIISATSYSQQDSIHFVKGTWDEVIAKAKADNKPIFVDCYASWCGPCKWMVAHVFNNDTVAKFYNEHFICFAQDMEKGDGLNLKKQFNVFAYPTYMFLDKDGNPIHRSMGSMTMDMFMNLGRAAVDTSKCYFLLKKRYDAGERNPDLLYNYAIAKNQAGKLSMFNFNYDYEPIAHEYFQTQSPEELLNRKNWASIQILVNSIYDPVFNFVMEHRNDYSKRYGKTAVDSTISNVAYISYSTRTSEKDSTIRNKAKEIINNINYPYFVKKTKELDDMNARKRLRTQELKGK